MARRQARSYVGAIGPYERMCAEQEVICQWFEKKSGAKRIMDACREQGVEEPVWKWVGGFVIVTFKRPALEVSDDLSTTQAGLKYAPSSPQVRKLIGIMPDGYADMKEIMALCGLKSLKWFRKNYILPALADGTLERLYPDLGKS